MQACMSLAELKGEGLGGSVSEERLQDCVNVILSYQNGDGGWATYENTRSYSALEVMPDSYFLVQPKQQLPHFSCLTTRPRSASANSLPKIVRWCGNNSIGYLAAMVPASNKAAPSESC